MELASIKLAVIGLGWIGQKHAQLIQQSDEAELAGVCDVDATLSAWATSRGVQFHSSITALIQSTRLDGVIIALPNDLHWPVAAACAASGIPMLIEKPVAESLSAAERIVQVAREHNVCTLVGHHRRHSAFVQRAKTIIASGQLGRLVGASLVWALTKPADYFDRAWRCERPGGGPLMINLIHELDLLRFLCGEIDEVFVHGSSQTRGLDVEDSLTASLRFVGGAIASIFASDTVASPWSYEATTAENPHYFQVAENCYQFFGTRGSLGVPRMDLWSYASDNQVGWQHPLHRDRPSVTVHDPLKQQLAHFCRVIRGDEPPLSDAADATKSLSVALAMLQSIESGKPTKVT